MAMIVHNGASSTMAKKWYKKALVDIPMSMALTTTAVLLTTSLIVKACMPHKHHFHLGLGFFYLNNS
jgi:hypothetical protein